MLPISPHAALIQSSMHNTHSCFFASFAVFLFLSPLQAWGQTENDTLAHFMCIWPEPDSLLEWTILRELIPPDCEHFMDESTTDMGQEECTDKIAYRNGNFMHFPATKAGVYMFFGVMPGSSDIRYSGVVRLGEDILDDWPGAKTDNGIPLANMMWLDTRALWYPFCN